MVPQQSAKEIFIQALDMSAEPDRQAFLASACAGDEPLRREVDQLLHHQDWLGSFLETGDTPAEHGMVIGPYKLLQQIGEGGMGAVYLAEQTAPLKRLVALKLIKQGMDSQQVIARFEAERQALALMDHPNIAKVLDAGTTGENDPSSFRSASRPYFVMELVKGAPITNFCDDHHLTLRERLELFLPVCEAVQHAHQKGVIHRDLKPSNVLVALYDGRPVPKIIDFGVAKAIEFRLTEKALNTEFGAVVGTLEYMSPEQAEANQLDIDTRSDIYALGVLVYELLTGTPPLERMRLRNAALLEVLRVIREEEPPRPSTRLSTTQELPAIAANRGLQPNKLSGLVRGELDWIVMKCLEKDRNRRYETANALALDLGRYLRDEPVQACPPSAGYRLRKFLRRHKGLVLAASAGLLMLVITLALALVSNYQISEAFGKLSAEQQKTAAALLRETALKRKANDALEQESLALYSYRIGLAYREWHATRVARADSLLAECPVPLRGWEWHYLDRLCHSDALTIRGHRANVYCVTYSPDGKVLASGGADGIRLWEPDSGRQLHWLPGQAVYGIAFRPDGRQFVSASTSGPAKLWDTVSGQALRTFKNSSGLLGVAFSPDGTRFATAGEKIRLFDPDKETELFSLPGGSVGLMLSPDGKRLASANSGVGNSACIWDLASRQQVRLSGTKSSFLCLRFSPDGRWLATGHDVAIRIWDAATGQMHRTLLLIHLSKRCRALTFSPDGKWLASAHADQTVRLWSADGWQEQAALRGHTGFVYDVAFSPDSRFLASCGGDKTVKIWRLGADQEAIMVPLRAGEGRKLVCSPDNRHLAVIDHRPLGEQLGPVMIVDAAGSYVGRIGKPEMLAVQALAYSSDGQRLATGEADGMVRIWDVKTGDETCRCTGQAEAINALAFSADGLSLAATGRDRTIQIWDANTGQQLLSIPYGDSLASRTGSDPELAFHPDGRRLALSGPDRSTRIWDTRTGKLLFALGPHDSPVSSVAFSRNGKLLASGSTDRTIKLWDADTGKALRILGEHGSGVASVCFNNDDTRLAAGVKDGSLVIWDLTTFREALTLRGDAEEVYRVAFTPDGRRLACTGREAFLRIFDGTPRPPR